MHLPTLALQSLLLGSAVVLAAPSSKAYAVKEKHAVPRGWTAVSRPSRSHVINLDIGLKQRNQDKLEQHVIEVSDPSHARYGQYLSASEVKELVAPSDETIELVKTWLSEHGISAKILNPTEDSILVALPVEKVEELLDTTYSVFRHEDGTEFVRTPEWSLPQHLHEHIDVIQPTNSFFRPNKEAKEYKSEDAAIIWNGGEDWWKGPPHNPVSVSKFDIIAYSWTTGRLTDHVQYQAPNASCDISTVCNVTGTNLAGATVTATTLTCLRCLYGTINYVPKVPEKNMIGVTNYLNEVCGSICMLCNWRYY